MSSAEEKDVLKEIDPDGFLSFNKETNKVLKHMKQKNGRSFSVNMNFKEIDWKSEAYKHKKFRNIIRTKGHESSFIPSCNESDGYHEDVEIVDLPGFDSNVLDTRVKKRKKEELQQPASPISNLDIKFDAQSIDSTSPINADRKGVIKVKIFDDRLDKRMMLSMTVDRAANAQYFKKLYKENKILRNSLTQKSIRMERLKKEQVQQASVITQIKESLGPETKERPKEFKDLVIKPVKSELRDDHKDL